MSFIPSTGCVVENKKILPYYYTETNMRVWIPPEGASDPGFLLLRLRISYNGYVFPEAADRLKLGKSGGNWSQFRPDEKEKTQTVNLTHELETGWTHFHLDVTSNLTLTLTSSTRKEVLFNFPLELELQEIEITGSNLTLNCAQGKLVFFLT